MKPTATTIVTFSVFALSAVSGTAAVIASTNFDGRTLGTTLLANDTATGLSWTTNGVADPGNMAARQWGGAGQALFNSTALTQNMFAPALNVGNAGDDNTRSWTTTINLAVLPGSIVSLESVAFDYWAVNGSGLQNVARNSDFVVTLFSPTVAELGEVSLADVSNGATAGVGTPVLLQFSSAIALSDPGTYSLRIRGGDIDNDETGNHTGIDNLSINGTVVIPEPSTIGLLGFGLLGLATRRRRS